VQQTRPPLTASPEDDLGGAESVLPRHNAKGNSDQVSDRQNQEASDDRPPDDLTRRSSALCVPRLGQVATPLIPIRTAGAERRPPAYQRTKRRLGRQRGAKVAQIELARKLTEAIWYMLTRNQPFQPFAPAGAISALTA